MKWVTIIAKGLAIGFILAWLVLFGAVVVQAQEGQPQCDSRENLVEYLWNEHKERPVASAIDNRNILLELFSTKEGTTWSILLTGAGSPITCIVAAGEFWMDKDFEVPIEDMI
jgi:hypothetical protein